MGSQLTNGLSVDQLLDSYSHPSVDVLFDELRFMTGRLADTSSVWPTRGRSSYSKCVSVLEQFVDGRATTPEVKAQFLNMSTLMHEVHMDDEAAYAALAMAAAGHAAAHLGHLTLSMSNSGATHRVYDELQKAYTMYGLGVEATEFVDLALGFTSREKVLRSLADKTKDVTYDQLFHKFSQALDIAWSTQRIWPNRARPAFRAVVEEMERYHSGDATTADVKVKFFQMTTIFSDVVLDDRETYAALALGGIAHAAAHLGHMTTSMSHAGDAHRVCDAFHGAYALYALAETQEFTLRALHRGEDYLAGDPTPRTRQPLREFAAG